MNQHLRLKIIGGVFSLLAIFSFAPNAKAMTCTWASSCGSPAADSLCISTTKPNTTSVCCCIWPDTLANSNCSWLADRFGQVCGGNENMTVANDMSCGGEKLFAENKCCCPKVATVTKPAAVLNNPFDNLNVDIPGLYKSISCKKNADGSYTCPKVNCESDDSGATTCEVPWIAQYIIAIYNYALIIIGSLAAVTIMAGGVIWLISGSNATRMKTAKEMIIGSVSGLIVMFSSYMIISIINPDILIFKPLEIGFIKKIQIIDKEEITGCNEKGSTKKITVRKFDSNVITEIKNASAGSGISTCYYYALIAQESQGDPLAFNDDRTVAWCNVYARRNFICSKYPACCGTQTQVCNNSYCHNLITDKKIQPPRTKKTTPAKIAATIDTSGTYSYGFGLGQITWNTSSGTCNGGKGFKYQGGCYSFVSLLTAKGNLMAITAGTNKQYCPQAKNGNVDPTCFVKYNGSGTTANCTGQKKWTIYQKCLSETFEKISNTAWSQ